MRKITYRSFMVRELKSLLFVPLLFLLFSSCTKKETIRTPPVIGFVTDSGYASRDTTLMVGQKIRVGVRARGTDGNITYFSIRYNDGAAKILLDTGMNRPVLNYTVDVIKTASLHEKWTFLVMDRNRNFDSISLYLTKSDYSKWGKIRTLPGISLGAQERSDTGSFLSLAAGQVFNLGQAWLDQQAIDMIYYYGQYEGTLASPMEAEAPGFFTGAQGIANWTIKNETRYDTTALLPAVFDAAGDDSLLLSAYDPTAGKRKAKYLQPGMVVAFKSPAGKLGLIKVTRLSGTTAGTVTFTVKIQE